MIGYDDSGGFAIISTLGAVTGQASIQNLGTPVTSVKHTGTEWLIGQAGEASGYSRVDKLGGSGLYTAYETPSTRWQRTYHRWLLMVPKFGSQRCLLLEVAEMVEGNLALESYRVVLTQAEESIGRKVGHSRFPPQSVT